MTRPIAPVTGGSRGLGRSSALHLADAGADVVVAYRSKADEAKAVVAEIEGKGGTGHALQLDTSDTSGFASFAERLGKVLADEWARDRFDWLMNDAGVGLHKPFAETTETDFGGGAVRDDDRLNAMIASQTAMGRAGLPDDIGAAVASILAGGSRWITAQRIEVSGGQGI